MNIIKKCISRIKKKDCCLNCLYFQKYLGECIYPDINDDDKSNIIGIDPLYYKCSKHIKSNNTYLFDSHINKLMSDWVKDATCNYKYKYSNVMYNINRKHKKITIMTNIPGLMIGRRGVLRNKYNEIFEYYGYKVILLESIYI